MVVKAIKTACRQGLRIERGKREVKRVSYLREKVRKDLPATYFSNKEPYIKEWEESSPGRTPSSRQF